MITNIYTLTEADYEWCKYHIAEIKEELKEARLINDVWMIEGLTISLQEMKKVYKSILATKRLLFN